MHMFLEAKWVEAAALKMKTVFRRVLMQMKTVDGSDNTVKAINNDSACLVLFLSTMGLFPTRKKF